PQSAHIDQKIWVATQNEIGFVLRGSRLRIRRNSKKRTRRQQCRDGSGSWIGSTLARDLCRRWALGLRSQPKSAPAAEVRSRVHLKQIYQEAKGLPVWANS